MGHVVKCLLQKLTRAIIFNPKSDTLYIFYFKIMLFKEVPKKLNMSFLRNRMNQYALFEWKLFSLSVMPKKIPYQIPVG